MIAVPEEDTNFPKKLSWAHRIINGFSISADHPNLSSENQKLEHYNPAWEVVTIAFPVSPVLTIASSLANSRRDTMLASCLKKLSSYEHPAMLRPTWWFFKQWVVLQETHELSWGFLLSNVRQHIKPTVGVGAATFWPASLNMLLTRSVIGWWGQITTFFYLLVIRENYRL